ncbi:hypothetical protein EHS25_006246 [Saitozyma podzolica]|uniref:ATP-dependent DNA ligase family profile domain-containing protein n=1 Tax=Saitozyma podzolica TaxID=1890683 RepID=A0A427YR90_9TREE|nr:hypothetical protein EHS25_006246 [Saitozyma podzolica]
MQVTSRASAARLPPRAALLRPSPSPRAQIGALSQHLHTFSTVVLVNYRIPRPRLAALARHVSGASPGSAPVVDQLRRVAELQRRVAAENSKSIKQDIIAEYPDLRDLLEHVYDPSHRTHLSSSTLRKHLRTSPTTPPSDDVPPTLSSLFDALWSRRVTGNEAKDLVVVFLRRHGVLGSELALDELASEERADADLELVGVFQRLLDRNLVAGFGARTLRDVPWSRSDGANGNSSPASKPAQSTAALSPARSLEKFECALGKAIEPPFSDLSKHPRWFASRKLDGVRALCLLDFLVPFYGTSPSSVSAQFVSRTGKPFTSLSNLGSQLRHIDAFPRLRELLERDPATIRTQHDGPIKRLVLDGEVCVMRSRSAEEMQRMAKRHDDGTGAAALMNHTIEHPAYFLFDVLSWGEVSAKGALPRPLGRTFGERIEDLKQLTQWLDAELERQGVKERFARMLVQWEVMGEQQDGVQGMVHRAADKGWEGLIFRADRPYKGTRSFVLIHQRRTASDHSPRLSLTHSPDIRKFKQWQDAEYVVTSLDTSRMRLAIDGVFAEHEACSNVWIKHKGTPVSIGSGFTAEQRLAYAKDPSLIVGKEITVEYFSESEAAGRPGALSLRFPRVKKVWEGKRDV